MSFKLQWEIGADLHLADASDAEALLPIRRQTHQLTFAWTLASTKRAAAGAYYQARSQSLFVSNKLCSIETNGEMINDEKGQGRGKCVRDDALNELVLLRVLLE